MSTTQAGPGPQRSAADACAPWVQALPSDGAQLLANPRRAAGDVCRGVLKRDAAELAAREIRAWPGYVPTPLVALPGLAEALGVSALQWKDEGGRFGIGSFKALGGAYAVLRSLSRAVEEARGSAPSAAELASGELAAMTSKLTVACATDANHGRAVAWGARTFHCRCEVFLHEHVSEGRQQAIAAYGASTRRVPGNYDDSVDACAEVAECNGWAVISDTSYPGYTDAPTDVMHGYTLMAAEALDAWRGDGPPTHVFVQGGVGGVAAAIRAVLQWRFGASAPLFVVAEPLRSQCLLASARVGRRVRLSGDTDTVMAGLACGEPSLLAWDLLDAGTDAFAAVPDSIVAPLMRHLAEGEAAGSGRCDVPIVAGESAVGGLAALALAASRPAWRATLGLNGRSRVLLFGTEGATDAAVYERLTGLDPARVAKPGPARS